MLNMLLQQLTVDNIFKESMEVYSMKKWFFILLFVLLVSPFVCQAGIPGFMKERMGTLSGQVMTDDGNPVPGGVVSFFDAKNGIPPLIADMHRIPDMIGRMGPDGRFSVKLLPGSYYMGALLITVPGRGPGPPQKGETFYFAKDTNGGLRTFTLGTREEKDAGVIIGAAPETFPLVKNLVTIEGMLLKEDGKPFVGGVVLIKSDMNSQRPDFISQRTGEDGKFRLQLPPDTTYYLLGRERSVGRPVPGSYVGTYAYYQQQRDKGSTYQAAVRSLAFKWIRILYRCWQSGVAYDESRYLKALERRGSPLVKRGEMLKSA